MKMFYRVKFVALSLLFIFFPNSSAIITYDVVKLGAKPDGNTDSTLAFQRAWNAACGSSQQARIYVPQGAYLLLQSSFEGPCKNHDILIEIIGSIVAPSDYNVLGEVDDWILFQNVNGVTIIGGILDAKGNGLWNCKNSGKNCPRGATTLTFLHSSNINIRGLTSKHSEFFHIAIVGSQSVKLEHVKVFADGNSPNTDGIHVQQSIDVKILHTKIRTGDDCISIGPGTSSLWIENVSCGPGHGISIGSLGRDFEEEGVHNITVTQVSFSHATNGVRIKTWGKACNSFVRDVVFQHAVMDNVQNPIIIDQNYCPGGGCPSQDSGVRISNITYRDIHGTSASEVAMNFDCSSKNPCGTLNLEDINLTYENQPAIAECRNAGGKCSGTINPKSCFHQ